MTWLLLGQTFATVGFFFNSTWFPFSQKIWQHCLRPLLPPPEERKAKQEIRPPSPLPSPRARNETKGEEDVETKEENSGFEILLPFFSLFSSSPSPFPSADEQGGVGGRTLPLISISV